MESKGPLHTLQQRIHMLLVLILFVPVVFEALFGTSEAFNENVLNWGMIIAVLVGVYLIFEVLGPRLSPFTISISNILVLINIAAFVPVLFLLAQYPKQIPEPQTYIFYLSLGSVMLLPVAVLGVLLLQLLVMAAEFIIAEIKS